MPKGYKNTFDENFFEKDNEQSFYWAGFIAADGCVRFQKSKYSVVPSLIINLSKKDHSHLEKFKNAINGNFKICTRETDKSVSGEILSTSRVNLSSEKILHDLSKFDIKPRKSFTLNFPQWLSNHKLVKHYMRGYFDGDGGFYDNKSRINDHQMTLRICGTIEFLNVYNKILKRECDFDSKSSAYMYNGQGALNYSGNVRCSKIGKFLYENSNISLDRKYNQAMNIKIRSKTINLEDVKKYYRMYWSTFEVGKILGFSQSGISNFIRNNELNYLYQEKIDNGIKSTGTNGRVIDNYKGKHG